MRSDFDYLIVGAGLYGVTFARVMTNIGKRCLIIDKRDHIGGNCYDEKIEATQTLDYCATFHKYGPHVFHTSNNSVWEFVNKYAHFTNFKLNVLAIDDDKKLYHLPFNMNTMYDVFGVTTPAEARSKISDEIEKSGLRYKTPENLEEQAIQLVGKTIYEKLVKNYTEKQWNASSKELSPEIIKRLPVRMSYDNNYFDDTWQGIPKRGYAEMINKMIKGTSEEQAIPVILDTDFLKNREGLSQLAKKIVYCGSVDELFDYNGGTLRWRSLQFDIKWYRMSNDNTNGTCLLNFVGKDIKYTRVADHVWFTPEIARYYYGLKVPKTFEKSVDWKVGLERYYPINNKDQDSLYREYCTRLQNSDNMKNVILGGRLGKHKYFDMDDTIAEAMKDASEEIRKLNYI